MTSSLYVVITAHMIQVLILMIKMLIFGSRSGVVRYGFLMVQSTLQAFTFSNRKPCFTVFYKESYFCTIQSSTNRKAIKTVSLCSVLKYLSNVKVMHVFKCIFILRYLINIIIIFFPLALYCLLYCSVCVVQGIKKNKKKTLIQVSHYAFSNSK